MLRLITEYINGFKIYKCTTCNHVINIARNRKIVCLYCGEKEIDNNILLREEDKRK